MAGDWTYSITTSQTGSTLTLLVEAEGDPPAVDGWRWRAYHPDGSTVFMADTADPTLDWTVTTAEPLNWTATRMQLSQEEEPVLVEVESVGPVEHTAFIPATTCSVTKMVLHPTLELSAEITEALADGDSCEGLSLALWGGTDTTTTALYSDTVLPNAATQIVKRLGGLTLVAGQTYTLGVSPRYAVGGAWWSTVSFTASAGFATRPAYIRQRLRDIIMDAALSVSTVSDLLVETTRSLRVVEDRFGRPRALGQFDLVAKLTPYLIIEMPVLGASSPESGIRRTEVYTINMSLIESGLDADTTQERAMSMVEKIRQACDSSFALGMFGIADRSWSWKVSETPELDDKVLLVDFALTLPVQAMIGKGPFDQ